MNLCGGCGGGRPRVSRPSAQSTDTAEPPETSRLLNAWKQYKNGGRRAQNPDESPYENPEAVTQLPQAQEGESRPNEANVCAVAPKATSCTRCTLLMHKECRCAERASERSAGVASTNRSVSPVARNIATAPSETTISLASGDDREATPRDVHHPPCHAFWGLPPPAPRARTLEDGSHADGTRGGQRAAAQAD